MKRIQSNMIQTILENNGKFSHYRATLPVPKEYAVHMNFDRITNIGNRFYFDVTNPDWDELWKQITAAQVIVNTIKREQLEQRHEELLNRLSQFK